MRHDRSKFCQFIIFRRAFWSKISGKNEKFQEKIRKFQKKSENIRKNQYISEKIRKFQEKSEIFFEKSKKTMNFGPKAKQQK